MIEDMVIVAEIVVEVILIPISKVSKAESVEFIGMGIAHLAADPNNFAKTGRILKTCDLVNIKQMNSNRLLCLGKENKRISDNP